MGLFNSIRMGSSGVIDSYEIDRSIRLNRNDSSYFEISRSSDGNRKKWTFSTWLKVANHGNDLRGIFAYNGTGNNRENFTFESDGKIAYQLRVGGSNKAMITTLNQFRDPSAWYHIVLIWDSDNGTSADRAIIYVNGVRQEVNNYITPASGAETYINSTTTHYINNDAHWGTGDYSYAETYFIDGQAYDPTYFAETDATTGQWNPKEYTSGFSGNSFYCNYSDNSGNTSTTIGKDSSGLSNNITPFNVSVSAGTGNDSLTDTPTNNFCTLNPLQKSSNTTLSEGNLKASGSSSSNYSTNTQGTFAQSSGKWYYEVKFTSGSGVNAVGWGRTTLRSSDNPTLGDALLYRPTESDYIGFDGNDVNTTGASTGDIIQVAIDFDAGKIWFGKNGSYFSSGDPSAGSNPITTFTGGSELLTPIVRTMSSVFDFNFGQRAFSYTAPTGYKTLNSANLPDPTIKLPNKHFDTLLYSGTGSSQNITGLEFQPDWVWIKKRSNAENHELQDSVRGATKRLASNTTDAESTISGSISAFNSNGFTVVDAGTTNENGNTYVAWNWNAGGSTVTNNDGSISSQVRANTSAGFSIIAFEGTGSLGTVGHGLGVKPDVMIFKNRDEGHGWNTYHSYLGATKNLQLQTTAAVATASNKFNDTEPTSTVMTVNTAADTNQNNMSMICYCFSEVASYSKFGRYVGNGSDDGVFVFMGFKPAWIMIKMTSGSEDWPMYDNKRDPFNVGDHRIFANTSGAEGAVGQEHFDFVSNGIKFRKNKNPFNASGSTYIYFAFAESPFKNSRAR